MGIAADQDKTLRRRPIVLADAERFAAAGRQGAKNALLIDWLATGYRVGHFAIETDVLKEGGEAVIVVLAKRIELVVVAAGTAERETEHCRGRGADDVVELIGFGLYAVVGFVVPHAETVVAGRRERVVRHGIELVAGKLLDQELVVGFVLVQGPNDIVAIPPGQRFFAVALVTVALGEANNIQPVAGPALAILRTGKQAIDQSLIGVGPLIGGKGRNVIGGWRQAG